MKDDLNPRNLATSGRHRDGRRALDLQAPHMNICDPNDPRKWAQCANWIVTRIQNGQYRDGEWLPTIEQLSDETGMSDATVFKALDELQGAGVLSRVRSRGFYVGTGDPDKKTAEIVPELINEMSPNEMRQALRVLAERHPVMALRVIRYTERLTSDT